MSSIDLLQEAGRHGKPLANELIIDAHAHLGLLEHRQFDLPVVRDADQGPADGMALEADGLPDEDRVWIGSQELHALQDFIVVFHHLLSYG